MSICGMSAKIDDKGCETLIRRCINQFTEGIVCASNSNYRQDKILVSRSKVKEYEKTQFAMQL